MMSFILFLLFLIIDTAFANGEAKVVKRQCTASCYPTEEKNCATQSDGDMYYKEYPVDKCFTDVRMGGFFKYQCGEDNVLKLTEYNEDTCSTLLQERDAEESGCLARDPGNAIRMQLLRELPDNKLEIELCSVAVTECNSKYEISSNSADCTAISESSYIYTWDNDKLIIYDKQEDCQGKQLFKAIMIAANIRNKKSIVYSPSTFVTCNNLPVAAPPKKLEIFKCTDTLCGECAAKDSASYEMHTSGECLYDKEQQRYIKYECTKKGMKQSFYDVRRSSGCDYPQTYALLFGGCSQPYVKKARSYGPLSDGTGVKVELCADVDCHNYTLVKGTTNCKGVGSTDYSYTWKEDTLTIFSSANDCTANNGYGKIFVATGFDNQGPSQVYEQSLLVLCDNEGENPLPSRAPQLSLEIAACGDGNTTNPDDMCGMEKEGQCASSSNDNSGALFRSFTTGKCLYDDKKKRYYLGVCNNSKYGVFIYGERYGCDGFEGPASIEWGSTGCAQSELLRRARFVEDVENGKATVEYCFNTSCGNFTLTKNSPTCSPMGAPNSVTSNLPKTFYYTWDGTLTIYTTEEDCKNDSPSQLFTRAFIAPSFAEGSNVTYSPYQYATCDGKPVVGTSTTTASSEASPGANNTSPGNNNTIIDGCFGHTQTVLIGALLLFLAWN